MAADHRESLAQLLASDVAFECRPTVHWRDFDLANLRCLALDLAEKGVERYAIQVARTGQCLGEAYAQPVTTAPTTAELHALVHRLQPAFRHLELRE